MPRYALKIEYNGFKFYGWQKQKELPTIQGELVKALKKIDATCVTISGAGRTDAGVHATGQVAHVDTVKYWDPERLSEAINFHLKPLPIAVLKAVLVDENWNSRFDAINREYVFRIIYRRAPVTFEKELVWQIKHKLDINLLREAASYLVGTHDFTTFRSSICQAKSPIKTVNSVDILEIKIPHGVEYHFTFKARSYLHNQIRSFVGTLEKVGAGSWQPLDIKYALEKRSRSESGPVCPPHGLYLSKVTYPSDPFCL